MMIKRLPILIFSAFLACSAAFADDFSDVCSKIAERKVTKGSFVQTKSIKKLNREVVSRGTFIIADGEGIFWNTEKPFPSKMAVTKSAVIQTSASGKKSVMKSSGNQTFEEFSEILSSVFDGNYENLEKNFEINFSRNGQIWSAVLVPKSDVLKKFTKNIEMAGDSALKSVILNENTGDFLKYEFSNQVYEDSLTADEKALFTEQ